MAGGLLYFGLSRDVAGDFDVFELWRTDGTADGTVRVWQASGGQRYPYWRYLVDRTEGAFDGRLIFVVDDGQASTALWASDGTPQGDERLRQLGADHRFVQSFPRDRRRALFVLEQGPADPLDLAHRRHRRRHVAGGRPDPSSRHRPARRRTGRLCLLRRSPRSRNETSCGGRAARRRRRRAWRRCRSRLRGCSPRAYTTSSRRGASASICTGSSPETTRSRCCATSIRHRVATTT